MWGGGGGGGGNHTVKNPDLLYVSMAQFLSRL